MVTVYAADSTKAGHWQARAVMRQVFNGNKINGLTGEYEHDMGLEYLTPTGGGSRPANPLANNHNTPEEAIKAETDKKNAELSANLSLFPNPAKEGVYLHYASQSPALAKKKLFIMSRIGG